MTEEILLISLAMLTLSNLEVMIWMNTLKPTLAVCITLYIRETILKQGHFEFTWSKKALALTNVPYSQTVSQRLRLPFITNKTKEGHIQAQRGSTITSLPLRPGEPDAALLELQCMSP